MNQKQKVIEHLNTYGSITPLEALTRYGIMRLAAIIEVLRNKKGHHIVTEMKVHDDRRYASYRVGTKADLLNEPAQLELEACA